MPILIQSCKTLSRLTRLYVQNYCVSNHFGLKTFRTSTLLLISLPSVFATIYYSISTVDCGSARVVDDIYFVGTASQMCDHPDQLRAWNDASNETFPAASQYTSGHVVSFRQLSRRIFVLRQRIFKENSELFDEKIR